MPRLPFDPEPLLALFLTKKTVASLTGDLEERFQRICISSGHLKAALWFWWALLISIPAIIAEALKSRRTSHTVAPNVKIDAVVALLNSVSKKNREILMLYYLKHHPIHQIASMHNTSPQAVAVAVLYAKAFVRRELGLP